MLGEIALTDRDEIRIHTYTAPEEGWRVNSHIIEMATQLFVVDAQYMLPYAGEVVALRDEAWQADHPSLPHSFPPGPYPWRLGVLVPDLRAWRRCGQNRSGRRPRCGRRAREAWRRHSGPERNVPTIS